jgi:hypothetical protein
MNNVTRTILTHAVTPNAFQQSQPSIHDPFRDFGDHELTNLVSAALQALQGRGLPPIPQMTQPPPGYIPLPTPPINRSADMWDNAKIEQIICSGLKPAYDGSPEKLIPTMNLINIRRNNEVWFPATFIIQDQKKLDLVMNFSQIKEATVLAQAKRLWSVPDAPLQSHTRGTVTYFNRLLGVFLMNSLTPEFAATLHSRIDPEFCSDGPLLLHVMCQHIHRNHLAFVESIKNKIWQASLQEYGNDVPKYLRFLTENLRLISSTGASEAAHNDLIPHLLLQLRGTSIPMFQQTILKWQREFFKGSLSLTPTKLISDADQECRILQHAGQWVETIDPSVMAMQAQLYSTKTKSGALFQSIAANLSSITHKQRETSKISKGQHYTQDTPDWLLKPPTHQGQIKHFNGRDWHYCTKCGRQGRWVCTHTDATHRDSRRYSVSDDPRRSPSPSPSDIRYTSEHRTADPLHPRGRSPARQHQRRFETRHTSRSRSRSPYHGYYSDGSSSHPDKQVTWRLQAPPTPMAKLSLLESINVFLHDD